MHINSLLFYKEFFTFKSYINPTFSSRRIGFFFQILPESAKVANLRHKTSPNCRTVKLHAPFAAQLLDNKTTNSSWRKKEVKNTQHFPDFSPNIGWCGNVFFRPNAKIE